MISVGGGFVMGEYHTLVILQSLLAHKIRVPVH